MKPAVKVISQIGVFALFGALTLVLYYPARHSGFVTDWLGWQQEYDAGHWRDVLHCFGYKGMQQVTQAVMFGLYRLFGTDGTRWYLVFGLLHAFNGWLLFGLFRRILRHLSLADHTVVAAMGALLFLVSPYQAEVLIWRACVHYLLSGALILLTLHAVLNFLGSGKRLWLWVAAAIFLVSLFTLEIVLVTPILALCITLLWQRADENAGILSKLPPVAMALMPVWVVFFAMNKLVLGVWVGHYGASTHLHFQWVETLSRFLKYFVKHVFFARYFRHVYKEQVFGFLERPEVVFACIGVVMLFLVIGFFSIKKIAARWIAAATAWMMFIVSLMPVVTLYMLTLLHGENDRYGYVASLFLSMALALLLSGLKEKYRWLCWGIWMVVSVFYLQRTVQWWAVSHEQKKQLLESFHWYDAKDIVVLNLPDNLEGIHEFHIIGDLSALKEDLALTRQKPFAGNIREVAYYNATSPADGVTAEIDSVAGAIKVTFRQWGNWWWRNGIGAGDDENDAWRVDFQGQFYLLYLKNIPEGTVFLYCDGGELKELRMTNDELRRLQKLDSH